MTISYDITWDLDPTARGFRGRTAVRFCGTPSHAQLAASHLRHARLNGRDVPWDGARVALDAAGELEVDADFAWADDRGFRRVRADGATYLYTLQYPDRAPWSFCALDQRARSEFALTVNAPGLVLASSTETPIAPYALAAAAGPWEQVAEQVYATGSRAAQRPDGEAVSRRVREAIAFFEDLLEVPFPYGKCEALFVPDLPHLAFSSPGLILFDDAVLDALATREPLYATTVLSHEVAHAWSGNLVDAEPWLVEALATYLSRLATEHLLPGTDPWQLPPNAPWPDRPYAPHLARVRAMEDALGRPALLRALRTYFRRYAHTDAGWAEFKACLRE
ncbi:M1 family aminopeptidase [Actinosynnema sp. NPDC050436]|uniref:M1 family aminopeptidase n=1 Tax=Actinosynnema sp. NPDC050436 TaxID=3155659 RepID=UPI0033BFFE7D